MITKGYTNPENYKIINFTIVKTFGFEWSGSWVALFALFHIVCHSAKAMGVSPAGALGTRGSSWEMDD